MSSRLMTDANLNVEKSCVCVCQCVLAWQGDMKQNPGFGCLLSFTQ